MTHLVTVSEAVERTGIKPHTLYWLARERRIWYTKEDGKLRFRLMDVERYMRNHPARTPRPRPDRAVARGGDEATRGDRVAPSLSVPTLAVSPSAQTTSARMPPSASHPGPAQVPPDVDPSHLDVLMSRLRHELSAVRHQADGIFEQLGKLEAELTRLQQQENELVAAIAKLEEIKALVERL